MLFITNFYQRYCLYMSISIYIKQKLPQKFPDQEYFMFEFLTLLLASSKCFDFFIVKKGRTERGKHNSAHDFWTKLIISFLFLFLISSCEKTFMFFSHSHYIQIIVIKIIGILAYNSWNKILNSSTWSKIKMINK